MDPVPKQTDEEIDSSTPVAEPAIDVAEPAQGGAPLQDETSVDEGNVTLAKSETDTLKGSAPMQGYQTFGSEEAVSEKDDSFPANNESSCHDPIFAVLFWLHLIVVCGVIGNRYAMLLQRSDHKLLDIELSLDSGYLPAAFVSLAFGIAAAVLWTLLLRCCAYGLFIGMLLFNLVALFGGVAACVKSEPVHYIGAGACGILACVYILYLGYVFHRIPFAALLTSTTVDIMYQAPGMLSITIASLFPGIACGIMALAGLGVIKMHQDQHPEADEQRFLFGMLVLVAFSFFWTSSVITNILHTTICGVVGRWYYKAADWPTATSSSLKRALGKSFGSICLGSLVIAVLNTLSFLLRLMRSDDPNPAALVIMSVIDCILRWIEMVMEFFNTYAFAHVAIYGMKFTEAGSSAWKLFKSGGLDMIITYDLSSQLTMLGGLFGGLLSAGLTWASIHHMGELLYFQDGRGWLKPKDGELTWAYVVLSFFIGYGMVLISSTPVESGATALLVCYATNPDVLGESYPNLKDKFEELCAGTSDQGKQGEV